MTDLAMNFQEDPAAPLAEPNASDALLLDIDGYEGPIDVLLNLARDQKVDLMKISILQLARQYLSFIDRARERNLDLAAEYLVMAAWLAYLKSRLLLPKSEDDEEELSGEEMAAALAFQLKRLEAMQEAATQLFARPRLGQDVFPRGMAEGLQTNTNTKFTVGLYDMLRAYGDIKHREASSKYELPVFRLMSMDEAVERMSKMLGRLPKKGAHSVWATLTSFLPGGIKTKLYKRSALASTFTAGLEMAKQGQIELRQDGPFRPIFLRSRPPEYHTKIEAQEEELT